MAVVGIPHPRWVETVAAAVVPAPRALLTAEQGPGPLRRASGRVQDAEARRCHRRAAEVHQRQGARTRPGRTVRRPCQQRADVTSGVTPADGGGDGTTQGHIRRCRLEGSNAGCGAGPGPDPTPLLLLLMGLGGNIGMWEPLRTMITEGWHDHGGLRRTRHRRLARLPPGT